MNEAVANSQGPTSISQSHIVKEGWLQKRGEHVKNWRAR